ncbi:MAG: hypothetical protein M3680_04495 [Myxococcota bacterium]|nr:hypothetical protein [Myxococcota bacterium]
MKSATHLLSGILLAAFASQSAGCFIENNDPYYYEDATITAVWSFKNLATDRETGCPVGYDTVRLISQPLDSRNEPAGEPYIDLFDCADFRHSSALLPPDVYQVWLEVTTGADGSIYAQSTSAIVDVIDRDATFNATILNDGGYFLFDWTLLGESTNTTLSCQPGETIAVHSMLVGSTRGRDEAFDCDAGSGVTAGLVAGEYDVTITVRDANHRTIGTATTLRASILDRNRVTDLGVVTIPVENE